MGQISAGKFTERPPLSENINSTLLYQKIALKATYTTKKRISFSKIFPPVRDRRCFSVTCLELGAAAPEPHGAGRRYVVRWRQDLKAVAARIGRRVSMLCLTAPADYPPNLAACALYLPGQRHPGLRCAGLAAVPVPRSAGNAAGLRPACFLPLWSPMRLPSALLCHAAAAARRHTAYPSAKNTLRLRRNCFFVCGVRCAAAPPASALLRRGGPSGRPAEAWDGEERGGRGQVPPLRVSVGRAGPMGTRCSTRRGSRPKPQKRLQKWC